MSTLQIGEKAFQEGLAEADRKIPVHTLTGIMPSI